MPFTIHIFLLLSLSINRGHPSYRECYLKLKGGVFLSFPRVARCQCAVKGGKLVAMWRRTVVIGGSIILV